MPQDHQGVLLSSQLYLHRRASLVGARGDGARRLLPHGSRTWVKDAETQHMHPARFARFAPWPLKSPSLLKVALKGASQPTKASR